MKETTNMPNRHTARTPESSTTRRHTQLYRVKCEGCGLRRTTGPTPGRCPECNCNAQTAMCCITLRSLTHDVEPRRVV